VLCLRYGGNFSPILRVLGLFSRHRRLSCEFMTLCHGCLQCSVKVCMSELWICDNSYICQGHYVFTLWQDFCKIFGMNFHKRY